MSVRPSLGAHGFWPSHCVSKFEMSPSALAMNDPPEVGTLSGQASVPRGSRETRPIPRVAEGLRFLRHPLPSCLPGPLAGSLPATGPQEAIGFTESLRQKHDRFRVRLSTGSPVSLYSQLPEE